MNHSQYGSALVGYQNPRGYLFGTKDDPFGKHFAGGERCLPACSLYVGKFSAIRIGVEFVNV